MAKTLDSGSLSHNPLRSIKVDIKYAKSTPQIIEDILAEAVERGVSGSVSRHLVDAMFALRYPENKFIIQAIDEDASRVGDGGEIKIGDSILHITVNPTTLVLSKCGEDLENGRRPFLLVREDKLQAACQLAEIEDNLHGTSLRHQIAFLGLEAFIARSIEAMGGYDRLEVTNWLRSLIATYNEIAVRIEKDGHFLKIDLAEN